MDTFNEQGAIIALAKCGLSQPHNQGNENITPTLDILNADPDTSAKARVSCCAIS